MNRPSSRHLSHDFNAYKGLSLRELFWIVMIWTPLAALIFILMGAFIGCPVAGGCVGFLVGFVMSITVCPKRIARIKADKPQGYLMKKTVLLLSRLKLRQSPYLNHTGFWCISKIRGHSYV